jgi:hypothetical protein
MMLKSFFTADYLFGSNLVGMQKGDMAMAFFGLACILLAVVFKISAMSAPTPVDKKYRLKYISVFLTLGLAEVVWAMFRYENIRFFGTHFVSWLIFFICLVWLLVIFVKTIKNYSAEKVEWEKEQLKLKYLPK